MRVEKVFSLNSQQLSQYMQVIPELAHLADQILLKQITGVDFYRMAPRCLLYILELGADDTVIRLLYEIKQQIIDSFAQFQPAYQIFNGTVLEVYEEAVELCMPFHDPPVFMLQCKDLDYFPAEVAVHYFVQLLYVKNEIVGVFDAAPIPVSYVSTSVNFSSEFQSLEFMDYKDSATQQINNSIMDALPFDTPSNEIQTMDSYSHVDFVYPLPQIQNVSLAAGLSLKPGPGAVGVAAQIAALNGVGGASGATTAASGPASVRLHPSFSNLSLNTKPSMIIPEPKYFEKRYLGRVDFLIEQVGIIVMPRFPSLEQYVAPPLDYVRDFKISNDLGLIVGFCTGWFYQKGNEAPYRGDIVEFTIVPGYGFLSLDQYYNAADSATYPFINNFEENKNNKIGQIQKRQQTFATEITEFYNLSSFDSTDLITLSADQISVVHRFSKEAVYNEKMVHGATYSGVVYTYSEADNYGFIKSYGSLENAHSYAQGFEVYFKIQPQKVNYIPSKGDFVTFKSHWVDEKAQAREIRYLSNQMNQQFDGLCVGFYPPFVLFLCNDSNDDLANNLFFTKFKQIPQALKQSMRIGSRIYFMMDTDISTQFKAVFQCQEVKKSFSLSYRPSFDRLKDKPYNPFSEGTALSRLYPLPFVTKCEFFELKQRTKMNSDVVVYVSPYLQCESGNQPPDYLFSNGQIILNSLVFYNQKVGIQTSQAGYQVYFEGVSVEHVIFRENESDIRVAVSRGQVPLWVVGLEQTIIVSWTCRREEEIAHGTYDLKGKEVDAAIISGTISFKV